MTKILDDSCFLTNYNLTLLLALFFWWICIHRLIFWPLFRFTLATLASFTTSTWNRIFFDLLNFGLNILHEFFNLVKLLVYIYDSWVALRSRLSCTLLLQNWFITCDRRILRPLFNFRILLLLFLFFYTAVFGWIFSRRFLLWGNFITFARAFSMHV